MAAPKKKDEAIEATPEVVEETAEVETAEAPEPKAPRLSAVERLAKKLEQAQAKEDEKNRTALGKAEEELAKAKAALLKATERVRTTQERVDGLTNLLTPVLSDATTYAAVLTPAPVPTEEQAEAQLAELESASV